MISGDKGEGRLLVMGENVVAVVRIGVAEGIAPYEAGKASARTINAGQGENLSAGVRENAHGFCCRKEM